MSRFLLACVALATCLRPLEASVLWVTSANISVAVDDVTGSLSFVNTSVLEPTTGSLASLSMNITGLFSVGEVAPVVISTRVSACGASVCIDSVWNVTGENSDGSCCTQYAFVAVSQELWAVSLPGPIPSAVGWRATVASSSAAAWRTTLAHSVQFPELGADALFWAARQGNETASKAGIWEDVTRMLSASDDPPRENMQYGLNFLCAPGDAACCGEIMSVPALAAARASTGAGLGVMAAVDDDIFILRGNISGARAALWRQANRLGQSRNVSSAVFLVPLAGGDWRGLFAWARAAFPRFFLPPTLLAGSPAAHFSATRASPRSVAAYARAATAAAASAPAPVPPGLAAGLGLYSCANVADMNVSALRASGATHNWDAHFEWPYIGMYLPPIVPAGASWQSNTGSGEEGDCGPSYHHGQNVSVASIRAEAAAAAAAGITTLPYFNLFEYGEDINCALPPPLPPPQQTNDWRNATQFLADTMPDAIIPSCPGTGWQGGVVLDPASPAYSDFLVAQAQAQVDGLGAAFFGLAVDRFDHVETWVHSAAHDDGKAWCGEACHPLLTPFIATMARVGAVVYGGVPTSGRIITGNYVHPARIDALQHCDGVMSEDYENHIRLLYGAALSTTGKPPAMIWVYTAAEITGYAPTPDAFFGQHLIGKTFPFAPVLGADHSLPPSGDSLQQLYADWAPLFNAVCGGCWWLAPRPVLIAASTPPALQGLLQLNGFTSGGGCTAPGADAGNGPVASVLAVAWSRAGASSAGDSVALALADAFEGTAPATCESIAPGDGAWQSLPPAARAPDTGRWLLQSVPLRRGAALVRCNRTAASA